MQLKLSPKDIADLRRVASMARATIGSFDPAEMEDARKACERVDNIINCFVDVERVNANT